MIPGQYQYLYKWVMAASLKNGLVIWIGQFNSQATMTDIVVYITANGIIVHNANDAVVWTWATAQEIVVQIKNSGVFNNSSSTIYKLIRQELRVTCFNNSLNCTWEWYKHKAAFLT